jgi:hypothetical protein
VEGGPRLSESLEAEAAVRVAQQRSAVTSCPHPCKEPLVTESAPAGFSCRQQRTPLLVKGQYDVSRMRRAGYGERGEQGLWGVGKILSCGGSRGGTGPVSP